MNKKRITIIACLAAILVGACVWTVTPAIQTTPTPTEPPMVYVPEGEFTMGMDADFALEICQRYYSDCSRSLFTDEEPIHSVYLDAYWIDQTEVTNNMFENFVNQTGYQTDAEKTGASYVFNPGSGTWESTQDANWKYPHGPDSSLLNLGEHPVVHVSWNDAQTYCEWVGRRLPTEAEWEKAASGMDAHIYPWGDQPPAGNLLNFADVNLNVDWAVRSVDDGYQFTAPVGSYSTGASPYGVLDMAGNVWEWVADWYSETYYGSSPSSNPTGPASGLERGLRGGSWNVVVSFVRSAFRNGSNPDNGGDDVGFRCVLASP